MVATPEGIAAAFKELVVTLGYQSVTVDAICCSSHVSKRTFYRYFVGKEDVAAFVLQKGVVDPVKSLVASLPPLVEGEPNRIVMRAVFFGLKKDAPFWSALCTAQSRFPLEKLLIDGFSTFLFDGISKAGIDSNREKYMRRFFVSGFCGVIVQWISEGMSSDPSEMAELFGDWLLVFWRDRLDIDFSVWTDRIIVSGEE
ncbi:TetR/AcrR family transcriptional regulator [Adlercreutzia sp. R7]|uniref:TetR/AcrR family transcriptional regulator n=1 Tax=Adlercreutzia wanghongyangiae TaxID=3111451 RepID=A0ABU6IK08_9ACTN|nr:TetR/AcrR family transcriptional regulator [Adlercreutzia sp. R7]